MSCTAGYLSILTIYLSSWLFTIYISFRTSEFNLNCSTSYFYLSIYLFLSIYLNMCYALMILRSEACLWVLLYVSVLLICRIFLLSQCGKWICFWRTLSNKHCSIGMQIICRFISNLLKYNYISLAFIMEIINHSMCLIFAGIVIHKSR